MKIYPPPGPGTLQHPGKGLNCGTVGKEATELSENINYQSLDFQGKISTYIMYPLGGGDVRDALPDQTRRLPPLTNSFLAWLCG